MILSMDRAEIKSESQQEDEGRRQRAATALHEQSMFDRAVKDLEQRVIFLDAEIEQVKISREVEQVTKTQLDRVKLNANTTNGLNMDELIPTTGAGDYDATIEKLKQKRADLDAERERMIAERVVPEPEEIGAWSEYNLETLVDYAPLYVVSGLLLSIIFSSKVAFMSPAGFTDIELRAMWFAGSSVIFAPTLFLTIHWLFTIL